MDKLSKSDFIQVRAARQRLGNALRELQVATDHLEYLRSRWEISEQLGRVSDLIDSVKYEIEVLDSVGAA